MVFSICGSSSQAVQVEAEGFKSVTGKSNFEDIYVFDKILFLLTIKSALALSPPYYRDQGLFI